MTIGTPTYTPQGRFAFPRSYITHLHVFSNTDNVPHFSGSLLYLTSIAFPNITQYIIFKSQLIPWSSNTYSLNWIIDEWYYETAPFGFKFPYQGIVRVERSSHTNSNVLTIETDSANMHTYFALPPAPPTYWAPPPL